MKFYCWTLHNHWNIDVSKYFIFSFKIPSQGTFLFKPNGTMNVIIWIYIFTSKNPCLRIFIDILKIIQLMEV